MCEETVTKKRCSESTKSREWPRGIELPLNCREKSHDSHDPLKMLGRLPATHNAHPPVLPTPTPHHSSQHTPAMSSYQLTAFTSIQNPFVNP